MPVIETGVGNCHIFVDETAKFNIAKDIIVNAKVQRPGVCNAVETVLVHKSIAKEFLPLMVEELTSLGVEIRGCQITKEICPQVKEATDKDWETEYLDLILAVKVVDGIEEALDHISKYSTGHSESIITENYENAMMFFKICRFGCCVCKCFYSLYRWRRIWFWGRDRNKYTKKCMREGQWDLRSLPPTNM